MPVFRSEIQETTSTDTMEGGRLGDWKRQHVNELKKKILWPSSAPKRARSQTERAH